MLVSEIAAIPTSEATALEVAKNIFAKAYQGAGSRLHVTAYCAALEVRPGQPWAGPAGGGSVQGEQGGAPPAAAAHCATLRHTLTRLHAALPRPPPCRPLQVLKETAVRRLPVELAAWFTQLPEEGKFHKDVGAFL